MRCQIQAEDLVQGNVLDYLIKEEISIYAYKWVKYDITAFVNHNFDLDNSHIIVKMTIFSISGISTWIPCNVFR